MHTQLNHLNTLIHNTRRFLKYVEIKEAEVLLATASLKRSMPWDLRRYCVHLAKNGKVSA